MSRIRYLKPDFFKDEDLAVLPFEVRLFFAGLWNFADKAGRLEDRPLRLKAEIFPYDKIDTEKCLELLNRPKNGSSKPFIQRYEINNEKFIQILTWDKHQKPHHTEQDSRIPPPPPLKYNREDKDKGNGECLVSKTELSNGVTTVKSPNPIKDKGKEIIDIIVDLNSVLGTSYRPESAKNKELIQARISEGYTLDDFKQVHRKMAAAWGLDNKMRQYLRPITLYSTKFESYLNRPEDIVSLTHQQQANLKALAKFNEEMKNDNRSVQSGICGIK